jgi:hypothetical protein
MSRPGRLATLLIAAAIACTVLAISTSNRHPMAAPVPSLPVTAVPAAAPAATVKARGVCTGVKGCHVVARVDVDGDGRTDQVGVVGSKLATGGSITVRVRTATGHTLATTGRDVHWFAKPFFGAVPLDGRAGAEIVVGSTMGANYEEFRVVTYRGGKLVTLDAPPMVWTKAGMAASTPRWGIDGSYSFNSGVSRQVSDRGVVSLTLKTADRNDSGHGFTGHTSTYRWKADHWAEVSSTKVRYATDRSVQGIGGWHVTGLRGYAG